MSKEQHSTALHIIVWILLEADNLNHFFYICQMVSAIHPSGKCPLTKTHKKKYQNSKSAV